jgi:hypothetical protein
MAGGSKQPAATLPAALETQAAIAETMGPAPGAETSPTGIAAAQETAEAERIARQPAKNGSAEEQTKLEVALA